MIFIVSSTSENHVPRIAPSCFSTSSCKYRLLAEARYAVLQRHALSAMLSVDQTRGAIHIRSYNYGRLLAGSIACTELF